ncbi:hypothetical protein F5884DRAFT_722252 [Xylogone sp. PMI_703]|nr:hypothetical protein F5884DRAFT_722252 [Xylogone sp. PMI_703]
MLKVKSGCITCKKRRVKCDETKPYCQNCTRFGRKCGGYLPHTLRKPKKLVYKPQDRDRDPLPKTQAKSGLRNPLRPPGTVQLKSELEARYFHIFEKQTSGELSGPFQLSLWTRSVLLACQNEPFASHAVVALAALNVSYKSQLQWGSTGLPVHSENLDEHQRFALAQYDKAVRYMRLSIADPNRDLRKVLLSCLLIYCFESFQGRRDLAISQAQSGHKLFQDRIIYSTRSKGRRCPSSSYTCPLEIDIIRGFARLDLLLLTTIDTRSPAQHSEFIEYEGCTLLPGMPSVFRSIADAKIYIDLLMREVGHFMASALSSYNAAAVNGEWEDTPHNTQAQIWFGSSIYSYQGAVLSPEHHFHHSEYTAYLRRWLAAFEPLVQKAFAPYENSDIWYPMARLQIHARVMKILLAGTLFTSESSYDRFLPDFKIVVAFASRIVRRQQPSFSFDLSLIPEIGIVALRCRDWKVRREALELLKQPSFHRDVFWDKDMLEALARAVMETEEEGLRFGTVIPEARRARMWSVTTDEVGRYANVKMLLNTEKGSLIKDKDISW